MVMTTARSHGWGCTSKEVVKGIEKDKVIATASTGSDAVTGLLAEATHLLRSMRSPSLKAVQVSALAGSSGCRALLDGGATHALRTARSEREYEMATPVRVELAAGEVVLRQLPGSGILLSQEPTQTIVPLGKLILLGYSVQWDSEGFSLRTPGGDSIETVLEGSVQRSLKNVPLCCWMSWESSCVRRSFVFKFSEVKMWMDSRWDDNQQVS